MKITCHPIFYIYLDPELQYLFYPLLQHIGFLFCSIYIESVYQLNSAAVSQPQWVNQTIGFHVYNCG